MKNMRIIDFHTHPFSNKEQNLCGYKDTFNMPSSIIEEELCAMGIDCFCGSVIDVGPEKDLSWEGIKRLNDTALELAEKFDGCYVPGFHISPLYVKESLEEIDRMHKLGVNYVGEIVPYIHGWGYGTEGLDELLDLITEYDMIFNFHTATIGESFIKMVKTHPKTRFVAAHPGERDLVLSHIELMKSNENYLLDISGNGILRNRMLAYGIKEMGAERFIFGSDYPTCNPSGYIGAVLFDPALNDNDREAIFFKNAEKLLIETNNQYFVKNLEKQRKKLYKNNTLMYNKMYFESRVFQTQAKNEEC